VVLGSDFQIAPHAVLRQSRFRIRDLLDEMRDHWGQDPREEMWYMYD